MQLSEYLSINSLTATAFAQKIGRHKSTVTRMIKGNVRPDQETMQRILAVTDNQVTPNDFFGIGEAAE
jgi:plasmid maintenance system antidote protein VapI